jgi:hypothetical protein
MSALVTADRARNQATIASFLAASDRLTFGPNPRPFKELFTREALLIATGSTHWPALRNQIETRIADNDFLHPGLSGSGVVQEREIHATLCACLAQIGRARGDFDAEFRCAAWSALDAMRPDQFKRT